MSKSNNNIHMTLRGITLLETLLALTITSMVIVTGIYGFNRYQNNIKIQASANMLSGLSNAASLYGNDHYADLLAAAPQNLSIDLLEPYYGQNIGTDAFRTSFEMVTRAYTYSATDSNGNPRTRNALQILIIGIHNKNGEIEADHSIRADIANLSDARSGFISTNRISCTIPGSSTERPAGDICGAFGAYSINGTAFPNVNLNDVSYISLITKGDASVFGGQLYRYDYGDDELNRMNVNITMNNFDVDHPSQITGVDEISFDAPSGSQAEITSLTGSLSLESSSNNAIKLQSGNNRIEIASSSTNTPTIASSGDSLQMGDTGDQIILGSNRNDTLTLNGSTDTKIIGSSDLTAYDLDAKTVFIHEINSLHKSEHDPLRLQNFANGEVVVGKRIAYTPGGDTRYDISDGRVTTKTVSVQDIDCADCGGALSNILPRWRHMGTYFIEDAATAVSGTFVPKPNCGGTRRSPAITQTTGEDAAAAESTKDPRYEPRIIVVPKKFGMTQLHLHSLYQLNARMVYSFDVEDYDATKWKVYPRVYNGIIESLVLDAASNPSDPPALIDTKPATVCNKYTNNNINSIRVNPSSIHVKPAWCAQTPFFPNRLEKYAIATGLAMTYCKFTGGENVDPSQKLNYKYADGTDLSRGFEVIE